MKEKVISLVITQRMMLARLGTRKLLLRIHQDLLEAGFICGRDKLFDILRQENMLVRPRRSYTRTTNSYHRFYKYPNIIKDLEINRAEQVWVSDITYIKTKKKSLYLSLITDAYSKQIVGYHLSDNLRAINCIYALNKAVKNRRYPDRPLIHHSDRGIQYCCPEYIAALERNHIDVSMTAKHDPYENAIAERVNGILKTEFELGDRLPDQRYAQREVNRAVWIYNNIRPHESCGYLTPVQTHIKEDITVKKWPVRFKRKTEQNNLTLTQLCHT